MKVVAMAVLMVFLAVTVACGQGSYKKGDLVEVQTSDGQWKDAKVSKVIESKDSDGKAWKTYIVDLNINLQINEADAPNVMRPKGQSPSPPPAKKP